MKVTKAQRAVVRAKFGGLCAYCGEQLGNRWHVDHLLPVERELKFGRDGVISTGRFLRPERHAIENMMPACPPCNIDKHSLSLECWRSKLQDACEVLRRNQPTYRHAIRFGLVAETDRAVEFHFERAGRAQ